LRRSRHDERPKPGRARDYVPSLEQLRAVWDAAKGERQRDLVRFLLLVPLRRDEAAGLLWSEVDLDQARIRIGADRKPDRQDRDDGGGTPAALARGCGRRSDTPSSDARGTPATRQSAPGSFASLAYLFPSFNNGEPITPQFNDGERALADCMKVYWGAFVKDGIPKDKTSGKLAIFNAAGQLMSLQPNDRSFVLSTEMFNREHNCKFWEDNAR
jgi:hypothetical protein